MLDSRRRTIWISIWSNHVSVRGKDVCSGTTWRSMYSSDIGSCRRLCLEWLQYLLTEAENVLKTLYPSCMMLAYLFTSESYRAAFHKSIHDMQTPPPQKTDKALKPIKPKAVIFLLFLWGGYNSLISLLFFMFSHSSLLLICQTAGAMAHIHLSFW